jgi:hypothetical protein
MDETARQAEKARLQELYRSKSDQELIQIASSDPGGFTGLASRVLDAELSSRNLPSLEVCAKQRAQEAEKERGLRPVMIRRYRDLPDASIGQSVLESAGIESALADENLVRLDWFYSNLVGGIKLLVHEADADAANKLLDEAGPEKFSPGGEPEYVQPRCPRCQSMDVTLDGLAQPFTFGAMYLSSLPIPFIRSGWRCNACRFEWKEESDPESEPASPTDGNP